MTVMIAIVLISGIARERRFAKDTAQAVGEIAGSAAQRALQGV